MGSLSDTHSTATFAIVSDIDGVLTFNNKQVGNTSKVLLQLLSDSEKAKAPLFLASNNGGFTEDDYGRRVAGRIGDGV